MEPVSQSSTFQNLDVESVGHISGLGPIVRWLSARKAWDEKHAKVLASTRAIKVADRQEAEKSGYLTRQLQGEHPPLTSLAACHSEEIAREIAKSVDEVGSKGKKASGPVAMWMQMGSKGEESRANQDKIEEMEVSRLSCQIRTG